MKAISINVRKFMLEIFGDKLIDRSKLQQDIEDERIKGERKRNHSAEGAE